ncbi:MAG: putative integral membrane protein (TIGR00698 family) [Akkermansiaceae bacterium]
MKEDQKPQAIAASDQQDGDRYAWARHLNWLEGIGETEALAPEPDPDQKKTSLIKGLLLTIAIAIIGGLLSKASFFPFQLRDGSHPLDAVLISVILGMILGNLLPLGKDFTVGVTFAMRKLLPLGIVLMGARLNFGDLLSVGLFGLTMSLAVIGFSLFFFLVLLRKSNMPSSLRLLLGIGTAICGGTAIIAIAPIIKAKEKEVILGVVTVTFVGIIAMFLMPVIGNSFELSDKAFGIWAGLTIHQTPQVIASGFAFSEEAGETATVVKLARVCMLVPMAFALSFLYRDRSRKNDHRFTPRAFYKLIPSFLIGFFLMAMMRTMGLFPEITLHWPDLLFSAGEPIKTSGHQLLTKCSGFLLTISMAAIGLESKWKDLRQTNPAPFLYAILASTLIALGLLLIL